MYMLSAAVWLLCNSLFFSLRLAGNPGSFPRPLSAAEEKELERERRRQQAMLAIKKKFGKNAIIKGMDLQEGATAMERNAQIGGHKA